MDDIHDLSELFRKERLLRHQKLRSLILSIENNDTETFAKLFCNIHQGNFEHSHLRIMARLEAPQEIKLTFASLWLSYGDTIRSDSPHRLLAKVLWKFMPRYVGGPLVLFRGETARNYANGEIGFSWTSDPVVAESFAKFSGRSLQENVLLRAEVSATNIIFSSVDFGDPKGELEYVVDTRDLDRIEILQRFPASAA